MAGASVDSNESDCFVCSDGGNLLCCDLCPRAFHDTCLTPALDTSGGLPEGDWACPLCSGFGQGSFGDPAVSSQVAMDTEEKSGVRTRRKLGGVAGLRNGVTGLLENKLSDGVISKEQVVAGAKVQRLDGLSSPMNGRALIGKLSPVTPAQDGEQLGRRALRSRAGKDPINSVEQKAGTSGSRKRKAKDAGGGANGVLVKEEEMVFEFKVESSAEGDLRTPELKVERATVRIGESSVASRQTRKARLSAAFEEVELKSEGGAATGISGGVNGSFGEGSLDNLHNRGPSNGGTLNGVAQPELESDEDGPIASMVKRGSSKRAGKQKIESGALQGTEAALSLAAYGDGTDVAAEQSNDAPVPEEKAKKKRPAPRKRKNPEVDIDGGAGPSGAAQQGGLQLAPAGEQPLDVGNGPAVERPRNRRRHQAAAEAPDGGAEDAPAGGEGQDQGDRARARFLAIARRRAAHFAHFAGDDHVAAEPAEEDEEAEGAAPRGRQVAADDSPAEEPDWPGPFSTARKLVRERGAAAAARGEHLPEDTAPRPVVNWTPSRTLDADFTRRSIASLFEMSVRLLVDNAEYVESMEGIPDAVRRRVAGAFCARRKMIPETLSLFFRGSPGEIVLPDCTLVGEAEMTAAMAQTDTQRLEVLDLGMCGRCITDQGLSATFARGVNTLPQLSTLSLRGAYRLSDSALEKLLAAAPQLTSLELRRCSLMTEESVRMIADALGERLKGLSLEGCAQLDGARIQPHLLRLPALRRLSLSAVANVTDALVQELSVTLGSGLEELHLAGAPEVTDAAAAALSACCPNLSLLDLDGAVKLTDVAIARLADGCRGLRHLSLRRGKFTDEALAAFVTASGGQLRHLSVNNVRKAGDATLMALAKHSRDSLTSLDASWCRHVSDQGLGLLADSCRHLRNLRLFGCSQVTNLFLSGHSNPELVVVGQGDDVK